MTTPTTVRRTLRDAKHVPLARGQRLTRDADPPPAHHTTTRTEYQGRAA
ncbi:MAG: hypothetical protein ACRDRU_01390 [Pseudonocardiaceae bacterium]